MHCASETCSHAWSDNIEQECYDCESAIEVIPSKTNNTEDCPGQLFFSFFDKS